MLLAVKVFVLLLILVKAQWVNENGNLADEQYGRLDPSVQWKQCSQFVIRGGVCAGRGAAAVRPTRHGASRRLRPPQPIKDLGFPSASALSLSKPKASGPSCDTPEGKFAAATDAAAAAAVAPETNRWPKFGEFYVPLEFVWFVCNFRQCDFTEFSRKTVSRVF